MADDIALVLAGSPGLTAAALAAMLGRQPERAVSFALFAGHGRFRCDRETPPHWWLAGAETADGIGPGRRPGVHPAPGAAAAPIRLYTWQADALNAWSRRGRRGVVEAVTGTGKTMVGVAAVLESLAQRGQVLVLVPTVELQQQWVAELVPRLPTGALVGRLGAGATDRLVTHDVLVAVVNSARAVDVRPIRPGGLLVADECHRYGSAVNRLALDQRFTRRLGLSATYARDDDGNLAWLDPYFGGTCFRIGYERALADEVTAHFTVALMGVRFGEVERTRYDELSESMAQLRARLVERQGVPAEPFETFIRAVNVLADGEGDGSGIARAYRAAVIERRRLLADTPAKDDALSMLAPAIGAADRTIVFTQSIASSERACALLARHGLRASAVHSDQAGPLRREVLRRFGTGDLDVIAAPRILDEGIDVPAADLAVIAGASRSRRQMVQRMGRVLRRKPDGRRARFAVLYVEATVEDPRHGAHEAFLDEVVKVADEVADFPAATLIDDPVVSAFLMRNEGSRPQPPARLAPEFPLSCA